MSELGKWLRDQIDRRGLTLNAAAVYAGVGAATISDIINKGHIPRVDTLFRLADYFDVPRPDVLRIAGVLEDVSPDDDPDIRRTVLEITRIWQRLKDTDPEAAARLMRIAIIQAEAFEAAVNSATRQIENEMAD